MPLINIKNPLTEEPSSYNLRNAKKSSEKYVVDNDI